MNNDPSQLPRPTYDMPQQQAQQPIPTQPVETPLEYLNSISAPAQTKTINPLFLWLGIGGFLVLIIVLGASLLFGGKETVAERFNAVSYRIESVQDLTKTSSKKIKSSQLLAANGSLSTILNGANAELQQLNPSPSKKPVKLQKDSPLVTEFSTVTAKLEDARLNARFDTSYAREMSYQISKIMSENKVIGDETRSAPLKEYLETLNKDLAGLNKQFAAFNK